MTRRHDHGLIELLSTVLFTGTCSSDTVSQHTVSTHVRRSLTYQRVAVVPSALPGARRAVVAVAAVPVGRPAFGAVVWRRRRRRVHHVVGVCSGAQHTSIAHMSDASTVPHRLVWTHYATKVLLLPTFVSLADVAASRVAAQVVPGAGVALVGPHLDAQVTLWKK